MYQLVGSETPYLTNMVKVDRNTGLCDLLGFTSSLGTNSERHVSVAFRTCGCMPLVMAVVWRSVFSDGRNNSKYTSFLAQTINMHEDRERVIRDKGFMVPDYVRNQVLGPNLASSASFQQKRMY